MNLKKNSSIQINKGPVNIAIIGMACRFPEAQNYTEFWQHLVNGRSCGREFLRERRDNTIPMDDWKHSFSGNWDEANETDPRQRLLLESVWSCITDAGYEPLSIINKNIGVYLAAGQYGKLQAKSVKETSQHYLLGVLANDMLAKRISKFFDLHGPSISIDATCSSSLVAVHQAVQAIQYGLCHSALVGGINLLFEPNDSIVPIKMSALSPTGQCRSFDKDADGYVRGEGVGVILLKPLQLALHDNNTIYGVIKGTAVNYGGRACAISSPSAYLQSQVIVNAWKQANVSPNQVSYIEAHGLGVLLDDAIELFGLQMAFKQLSRFYDVSIPEQYCGIGAVKTNIGHLEPAAGIAGIIKVLLALKKGYVPELLHFQQVNPHIINAEKTPFFLTTEGMAWASQHPINKEAHQRFAGISSFGICGANAHIVIAEGGPVTSHSITEKEFGLHYSKFKGRKGINGEKIGFWSQNSLDDLNECDKRKNGSLEKCSRLFPTTQKQEQWFRLSMDGVQLNEFNIIAHISWSETLNLEFLQKSLVLLIQEQAVLRTKFIFENNKLYQDILPAVDTFKIEIEDAQYLSPGQREMYIKDRVEYFNNLAIPFTDYPLWQLAIIQFSNKTYELLIISSHLIMDAYGMRLMLKQLVAYYVAIQQGQKLITPKLEMTFVQYVIDQQPKHQSTQYANDLTYWQHKLFQPSKKLYLNKRLVADTTICYKSAINGFVISSEKTLQIKLLAAQYSCTDSSFLLALFRVVLFHYTHVKDIWIDVVDDLRNASNHNLIGWTAACYTHITTLSECCTFLDLIINVQNEFLTVKGHSKWPISNLCYPDAWRTYDAITAFRFNRLSAAVVLDENYSFIKIMGPSAPPKKFTYNFCCFFREENLEYHYVFLYNAQQFNSSFIQKMLDDCQCILANILRNPTIKIGELLKNEFVFA